MTRRFSSLLGDRAIIWVRCPIRLDEFSEPEPDFGLLRAQSSFYSDAFPGPADVLLLVEVAEATEVYDRRVKVPLYARAGIPEMWLVDLPRDRIVVRSRPSSGRYRVIREYRRGEMLRVAALPQVEVSVDAILG
jgi:Uma2 family endonuclease